MSSNSKHPTKKKKKESSPSPKPKPPKLNHIVELSEQYETHRNHEKSQKVQLMKKPKKSFIQTALQCFRRLIPCLKANQPVSLKINENEMMKKIQQIRKQTYNKKPVLPPSIQNKKTLVIDLDGVLIWSVFEKPQKFDFSFEVPFKDRHISVFTSIRFGAESFLFEMSKIYEIVVYSVRREFYVSKILQRIDSKHRISHVLHKDKCLVINKMYYLKNIKILGREQNKVIFVDHDPLTGLLQPDNFYQIRQFNDPNQQDRQLLRLMSFLKDLGEREKVTPIYENFRKFMNKEIDLNFIESYKNKENKEIELKKRKYGHKKTNSEVESFTKKVDDDFDFPHEESNIQLKSRHDNL